MTPQDLKNSILQLAIQGKLVEQRPEEGVAEVPAAHKHGGKEARRHGEIEPPFDIPESWKWVRLGDVVFNHGQKKPSADFSYIDIGSIDNKNQRLSSGETIVHPENASPRARKIVHQGDVIYSTVRPYLHNVCVIDREFSHEPIASTGFAVMACAACLNNGFLFYYLLSPDFDRYANSSENAKGVAYPAISDKRLYNAPFPLPPLAEQKRIVSTIEELLPLLARYEQAWTKLESFNTRFPSDLQKSLLQLAIQGKLVEQRPEEGTAETLYRQIQSEKHRLLQSGKIKKEKPLPEIMEDEIPFDIPTSWMWVQLGELSWFLDAGKSPSCPKRAVKGSEWGVITTTSIQIGFFDEVQNKVLPSGFPVSKSMQVNTGDILITRAGPTTRTGVACLVKDIHYNLILSDKTLRINMTNNHMCKDYVVMVLNSPPIRQQIMTLMSGMDKQQVNISQEKFKTVLIPLPPLAEQKRIVAKLEELLPQCKRLK